MSRVNAHGRGNAVGPVTRRQMIIGPSTGGLVAAVLAGCGPLRPQGAAQEPRSQEAGTAGRVPAKLRFMFRGGQEAKGFEQITGVFRTRYPAIQVETEAIPGGPGYFEKLLVQSASGTAADVTWVSSIEAYFDHVSYGTWLPLDGYTARDKVDLAQWYKAATDMLRVGGKLYALPLWSHPSVTGWFYNKDLLDQAGIKYPESTWTLDQLVEAARKLTKASPTGQPQDAVWGYRPSTAFHNGLDQAIRAFGGEGLATEGKRPGFNTPAAREAIQWVVDLFQRHRVAPPPGTPAPVQAVAMWATGYWGWWGAASWNFHWGVAQLPAGKRKTNGAMLQTDAIPISKNSKFPDAAWQLHRFHSTKEAGLILNENRLLPGSRPDVWNDPKLMENDAHRSWVKSLDIAVPLRYPANFRVNDFGREVTQAFDGTWRGTLNVDQGIAAATQVAEDVLRRPPPRR